MSVPKIRVGTLWLVLPIVLLLVTVWTSTDYPVDFWMHVNQGKYMWQHHGLVVMDPFTHTIGGSPVLNQAWLAQLSLYAVTAIGGYPLAQFLAGVLYASAFAIIAVLAYRRSGNCRITAGLILLASVIAAANLGVRPQAASVILFALLLATLWSHGSHWVKIVAVAAIELVWTNVHGAFPLGVVLPGIFMVGAAMDVMARKGPQYVLRDPLVHCYGTCCIAAFVLMFANPNGWSAMKYVTGVSSSATSRHVEEWLPPTLDTITGIGFIGSIGLVIAVLGASRKKPATADLLLLVALLFLGAKSQRMVIWWAMALPVVLAPHVTSVARRLRAGSRRHPEGTEETPWNMIVALGLASFLLLATPWTRPWNPALPATKRQTAVRDAPTQWLIISTASTITDDSISRWNGAPISHGNSTRVRKCLSIRASISSRTASGATTS